jgi:hypothetical protein
MNELDRLYAQLMQVGLLVLRQAFESGDQAWTRAEIELLHNIPSLLGEEKIDRHRYFWSQERDHYLDWLSANGSVEARSRMRTYYEPIWKEMEPLVAQLKQCAPK